MKRILPAILVLLSTLSLIIFLLWWNISEYNREKKNLKKELSLHLEAAINDVQEKQFNKFIRKLDVKVTGSDSLARNLSGVASNYSQQRSTYLTSKKGDSTSIFIWIDSVDLDNSELKKWPHKSDFRFKSDSLTTPVARYFKHEDDGKEHRFPAQISGLDLFTLEKKNTNSEEKKKVLKVLREKLIENKLPQNFILESDSLEKSEQFLAIEYDAPSFFVQYDTLYFQEYENHLLSKIGSSVLFSILLFVLVLVSFTVLLRSWNRQRQMVAMKNDFISNMTHELKTPISTVSVAIEAIRKYGVLEDRQRTEEYLEISNNELGRLSLLVEKVLRTTLFDSKRGFLNPQPIDFNVLVKETIQTMNMHFEEKQAQVTTDIATDKLMTMGDKVHLTNVIYNLIENAIKYSKSPIQIHIVSKLQGDEILFSVKDNGVGIAMEHQKHIFTKFYRVPNQDRHNVKGHGLGLSYVKQVINELKGRIELESREGQGTTFKVFLKTIQV